jgi:hypothetical protein
MAFYSPDAAMDQRLASLVRRLVVERGDSLAGALSITWLRYGESLFMPERNGDDSAAARSSGLAAPPRSVCGASWQGGRLRNPGDLVRLPYLIASERWLQRGLLEEEPELRRALAAMIRRGSHEATSYVVDRLSGTTSGPALISSGYAAWAAQRLLVNGWLVSLGWPELEGCVAAQKTWQDGPYGRERQFLDQAPQSANRFSSDGLARLLETVLAGTLISPPACQRMRNLLAVPDPQAAKASGEHEPLAAVIPAAGSAWRRFWGQGGSGTDCLDLALYGEAEDGAPMLLVVLVEPRAADGTDGLVATIVAELLGSSIRAV